MATYARRRSSSRASPSAACWEGKVPSSRPQTTTTCHSRPLAPWTVHRVTRSRSPPSPRSSAPLARGARRGGGGEEVARAGGGGVAVVGGRRGDEVAQPLQRGAAVVLAGEDVGEA